MFVHNYTLYVDIQTLENVPRSHLAPEPARRPRGLDLELDVHPLAGPAQEVPLQL